MSGRLKSVSVPYLDNEYEAAMRELRLLCTGSPEALKRAREWTASGGATESLEFSDPILVDGQLVVKLMPSPSMLALLDELRRATGGAAA